jgi:excinuclease ABC subunit C
MIKPSEVSFLPESAGCYIFHDKSHSVLYVGKAKNLRKRVSSYFQKRDHDPKTAQLLTHIHNIDIIVTPTEVDALLLENSLIQRYYPPFNIDLKDSRRYAYLLLRPGPLPWIEVARDRKEKGEYFGPFVSGAMRKLILDVLSRTFRILTRKPSPRLKKAIDPEMYWTRVAQAREILKGNGDKLISDLEEQMKVAATRTHYEYAMTLRNQINALKTLKEKQMIEMTRSVDAHILNYQIIGDTVYLLIFSIRKGVLEEKQEYSFPYHDAFLDEFLVQYYGEAPIPQELIVPVEVDPALEEYLSKKSHRKVSVIIPQRGDKKDLLDFVAHNVTTTFFAGSERVEALQKILSLPKPPRYIECFDISHLSGTNTVASMTTFTNGFPDRVHKWLTRQG